MKHKLIFFFLILMFFGCDPVYDIELVVENNSSSSIQIVSSDFQPNDTSRISPGTKLVVFNFYGLGSTTEDKLESIVEIPLDTLEISKGNGTHINKNVFEISNWEKKNPDFDGGQARIILTVTENDFE